MNLVIIPYHDWRKINKEGARTRDAHFIHHLQGNDQVEKVLIINRPTTLLEIKLKKNPAIDGKVILKHKDFSLYQVSEKLFVLDCISWDLPGQIFKKKKWFFEAFGWDSLISFFEKSISFLGMKDYSLLCQNVFASAFVRQVSGSTSVFDAWDNFLLFPDNKNIERELTAAYNELKEYTTFWITNSKKNVDYFTDNFKVPDIKLIKNGVDFELFQKTYPIPADMKSLPRPIIGFGGKLSHLFDYELYNKVVAAHPDKSFVIVGQKLSEEVFGGIEKRSNFHYLGDKHYSVYPSYVTNFDVGIIPYVNNHLDSGADSIKAYEYLAAGLNSIGTKGAGMGDLSAYMFVASDTDDFIKKLDDALVKSNEKRLPEEHSWKYKTEVLLKYINYSTSRFRSVE